jgi:transcriptional regulator with XRE-family HTH domain
MTSMAFGEFLRARRGQVTPTQVGLPTTGRRRVAGLRREEVATLAGLSVDYYVRLEQGRERHPSTQVLTAIADALQLDDDAHRHLFRIAGFTPALRTAARPERLDPDLLQLMDGWPDNPTLLLGRTYDVLARNRLGAALWRPFTYSANLLLNVFLDDAAPAFYRDWRAAAVNTVAGFRVAAGAAPDDPRVTELLRELRAASPEFVEIWDRNDARGKSADLKTFIHPDVGELTLRMQAFDVRSAPGQQLVVYHAEPGTASARALALLGTLAASDAASDAAPDATPAVASGPSDADPARGRMGR